MTWRTRYRLIAYRCRIRWNLTRLRWRIRRLSDHIDRTNNRNGDAP